MSEKWTRERTILFRDGKTFAVAQLTAHAQDLVDILNRLERERDEWKYRYYGADKQVIDKLSGQLASTSGTDPKIIANLRTWAECEGWDGVNNSKRLDVFVAELVRDLREELDELRKELTKAEDDANLTANVANKTIDMLKEQLAEAERERDAARAEVAEGVKRIDGLLKQLDSQQAYIGLREITDPDEWRALPDGTKAIVWSGDLCEVSPVRRYVGGGRGIRYFVLPDSPDEMVAVEQPKPNPFAELAEYREAISEATTAFGKCERKGNSGDLYLRLCELLDLIPEPPAKPKPNEPIPVLGRVRHINADRTMQVVSIEANSILCGPIAGETVTAAWLIESCELVLTHEATPELKALFESEDE